MNLISILVIVYILYILNKIRKAGGINSYMDKHDEKSFFSLFWAALEYVFLVCIGTLALIYIIKFIVTIPLVNTILFSPISL